MTLGVLRPYRRYGLGSQLLQAIIDYVKNDSNVSFVYLHVQVNNDAAIKFYTDKFGFKVVETIEDYYKKIVPHACHLLRLNIHDPVA